ncbi:DUF1049 domain-containing protein [bacterium]|nr:DUF1049 domain-containing protein [bacterium]
MWIVRWLVVAVVVLLAIAFTVQNTEQDITVRILAWEFGPLPLYLALIVAFTAGMLAFLLFSLFQQLQLAGDLARAKYDLEQVRNTSPRRYNHHNAESENKPSGASESDTAIFHMKKGASRPANHNDLVKLREDRSRRRNGRIHSEYASRSSVKPNGRGSGAQFFPTDRKP